MMTKKQDYKQIKGWGIDADPSNEPTHPMKNYTGDDHQPRNRQRPTLQKPTVEILHSIERPTYSAVIGESVPPSGLSGHFRRYAFQFSESSYQHWLPLLLADRINELEGIVDDLKKGKIPNIFVERGWHAEWKYNRARAIRKIAVTTIATGLIIAFCQKKRSR